MSIADLPTGVGGQGRTQYFNFQYDDSLSTARGRDLCADLMNYCDDDMSQVAAWFSHRALDMSPPITVSLVGAATDAAGDPVTDAAGRLTQVFGASWYGAVAWPLQVTIRMGEFALTSGDPTMLARSLLVAEVSEMYMRAINATGFTNPWFRAFNEGNKGEALSRFLAVQILVRNYPGVTALPGLVFPSGGGASFNVTNRWLDSPRTNSLEDNNDDNSPNAALGCGTLFLFYLHDQLGYSIEDIINAGGGHLSNVYQNLTGDSALNAWGKFSGIVDSHYPHSAIPGSPGKFTPSYFPLLETVFPVSDLTTFSATPQVSWVPAAAPGMSPVVGVGVDRPPKVPPLTISLTSSQPAIIPSSSITIGGPGAKTAITPLTVIQQAAGFTSKTVTLTASYAGKSLTRYVTVVSPDAAGLPELEIAVDRSADPCAPVFVEGGEQIFKVSNLNVFADQAGLSFSWSVNGATAAGLSTESLRIPTLPGAGTNVTVSVTVANAQGLHAAGALTFRTVALDWKVIDQELRCRLNRLKNLHISIPEWTPIEGDRREKRLEVLDKEVSAISKQAASVAKVVQSMEQQNR